jgi:proteasome lid subunit RPN8/RPN11
MSPPPDAGAEPVGARTPVGVTRVPAALMRAIHAHLTAAYPEEGCGVLLGRDHAGGREVVRVLGFDNRREDSRANRYLIDPEQLLAAEREARAAGLDVVGIFHSHPDHPARPSGFDLDHAWPYYSYLIVSVARGRVADQTSWRLREDRSGFDPETLDVVEEP